MSAALAPVAMLAMIAAVFIIIFTIVGFWMLLSKMGKPGWATFIPGYRIWQLGTGAALDGRPAIAVAAGLDVVVVVSNLLGSPNAVVFSLISVLSMFVFDVYVYYRVSKAFGHGVGYTIGLTLLGGLFMLFMASSRAWQYKGPLYSGETPDDAAARAQGSAPSDDVIEAQPVDGQAVDEQPVDGQPIEEQPAEELTLDAQPVEGQAAEAQPVYAQPVYGQAIEMVAVDAQIGETPLDEQASDMQAPNMQPLDEQTPDMQAPDMQPAIDETGAPAIVPVDAAPQTTPVRDGQPQQLSTGVKAGVIAVTAILSIVCLYGFMTHTNSSVSNLLSVSPSTYQPYYSPTTSTTKTDTSSARSIGSKDATVNPSQSVQWAGDDITGIIQVPSDWKVSSPYSSGTGGHKYEYVKDNQVLTIALNRGSYLEWDNDENYAETERAEMTIAGHNAVKVITENSGGKQKTTYYIDRPGVFTDGSSSFVSFEFSGLENDSNLDARMQSIIWAENPTDDFITLPNGSPDICESDTQWIGNMSAGYMRVSNDWVCSGPSGSGMSMAQNYYYCDPALTERTADSVTAFISTGTASLDWQQLRTIVSQAYPGASDISIEHVSVSGIDGHVATCVIEDTGTVMNVAVCYLESGSSMYSGKLITFVCLEGFDLTIDQLLETYTSSK